MGGVVALMLVAGCASFRRKRAERPCRGAVDTSYPRTGAVHNHRHSGESRNPEGPGSGVQSETPSLNPL